MLDWFIDGISNTFGKLHWPWVDKRFKLKDYFLIEDSIRELPSPFVVGIVKTNGHGANLLIDFAQSIGRDGDTVGVHALAHIGVYNGYRHRIVEAIGEGLQEVTLLEAIGQRDNVILRRPDYNKIPLEVCEYAIEYLKSLVVRDTIENIGYDNEHNYDNDEQLDCSETVLKALEYGFKRIGKSNPAKLIERAGKLSWAPADIETSDLFVTIYDSRVGFISRLFKISTSNTCFDIVES